MHKLTRWSVLGLALSLTAYAAEPVAPNEDLRSRALQEIQQPGKYQKRSTDAQVADSTGMLSLKDPMPEVRGRSWDYFVRMSLQTFQPRGNAGNDLTSSRFDLGDTALTLMPALTLGFHAGLVQQNSWSLGWGLGGRIAYASEKGDSCFDTGFCEPEARLNSLMLSALPELTLRFTRFNKWALNAGAELGSINYTQTSGNKLAAFSEQAPFAGWNTGIEYSFNTRWSALFAYSNRMLTKRSQIGLQSDNYELGTRLSW